MNRVVPLTEVENLELVGRSLYAALNIPDNGDIALEFPETVRRYGTHPELTLKNLEEARAQCQPGRDQRFVIFTGQAVAGMSIVIQKEEAPMLMPYNAPCLSGFICFPWRGLGLGTLSLQKRLEVVDSQFDGRAYSFVKAGNYISRHMVEKCGLQLELEFGNNCLYTYSSPTESS